MTFFTKPNSGSIFGSIQGKTSLLLFIILRGFEYGVDDPSTHVTGVRKGMLLVYKMTYDFCLVCNKRREGSESYPKICFHQYPYVKKSFKLKGVVHFC